MEEFYLNVQDTEIYSYIIHELVKRLPNDKHTINSKSIIEHIIVNLLLYHYKNWLHVAKTIETNEINMKEKIPYIMPFFLVKKSSGYKNKMEINIIGFKNR